MHIYSIQPVSQNYNHTNRVQKLRKLSGFATECEPTKNPSFKGGKGFLIGTGGGLIAGLAAIGVAVVSGGTAIPALLAGYAVGAAGVTGGLVGNRVEDALKEKKLEKDTSLDDDFYD